MLVLVSQHLDTQEMNENGASAVNTLYVRRLYVVAHLDPVLRHCFVFRTASFPQL